MSEQADYDLCRRAVALADGTRGASIELCALLDQIWERRAFDNPHHESERTFVSELGMSDGAVSKMRKIGRVLIRQYAIPAESLRATKSMDSLYLAAGAPSREEAERLVEQAAHLTHRDLKLIAGKADECAHAWEPLALRCCGRCGLKERVDNSETELSGGAKM